MSSTFVASSQPSCLDTNFLCCLFFCLDIQISELLPLEKKFKDLKAQLELKSYDLSLFQSRAEQNEHHKVLWFSLRQGILKWIFFIAVQLNLYIQSGNVQSTIVFNYLLGLLQLGEHVKRIEQELSEAKSAASEKQLLYENCVATVSMLEKSIHEHTNNRDGRLKDLEKRIKAYKAQVQSASKDLKVGVEKSVNLS